MTRTSSPLRSFAFVAAAVLPVAAAAAQSGNLALQPIDSGVLGNAGTLGGWGLHAPVMSHVFRVSAPVEVRELAYYQMSANPIDVSFAVTLHAWSGSALGAPLASAVVGPGSPVFHSSLNHDFVYASVAPVILAPGHTYVVAGTPLGDLNDFWYLTSFFTSAPELLFDESLYASTTPTGATGGTPVYFGPNLFWSAITQPVNYCTAGTTANGCSATISASAQPSVTLAHACSLSVAGVDGQRSGLLFYGVENTGFVPSPWGAGSSFLCVRPPTQRTATQSSGGSAGACDGAFALDWNAYQQAHPASLGNPWSAGADVYVQAWFRDPAAPSGTSLSDAVALFYEL